LETVNIGILAHVDAGKTSLTERLLFDTGVIERLGSVDAGTTQTDTGDIERRRGITIRSAVASFTVGDRRVNLIDTPGHGDFVAEVERALGVLDGAVLVVSAVEGVQPHTRVLMRSVRALGLPVLLFVNKIDRSGAREESLLADVARLLTPRAVALGTVAGIGTPGAAFREDLGRGAWTLAERDDRLLAALVAGRAPSRARLWSRLRAETAGATAYPLLFGSAMTGAGVAELLAAIAGLLPPSPPGEDRLRGRVFAIERGPRGDKVAYVRSYGGRLRARQRVYVHRPEGTVHKGHVSAVHVVDGGEELTAGRIARVHGLATVRIGDRLGSAGDLGGSAGGLGSGHRFAPPGLETTVRPRHPGEAGALHAALLDLADQDPLIRTGVSPEGESTVLLYGEVQQEVIAATLAEVYGVVADFSPVRVRHLERPVGSGRGYQLISRRFPATIGLRVAPGRPGSGVHYGLEVELGALPLAFHRAVEESVRETLDQGVYGWPVTDVEVWLTHCGYWSPVTVAGDFRDLAPLVLARALAEAGTRVYEPCHRFSLEIPADRLGPVAARLAQLEARVDRTEEAPEGWLLTGEIVARTVAALRRDLPGLCGGQGVWTSHADGDRPVDGAPPAYPRRDGNPFDQAEYTRFLSAIRREV
jgi:ribosomal protection tetracycline resistance protein